MRRKAEPNPGTALERLRAALERAGSTTRDGGKTWRCPAHDDKRPSLSIGQGDRGAVLKCHKGCTPPEVLAAINLDARDLFDEPKSGRNATRLVKAKGSAAIEATYDYRDQDERLLFQVVRYQPKAFKQRRPDGQGGWIWNVAGIELVPYRLPEVIAGVAAGDPVYICEGEKDADALHGADLVATCNPMGAGKWRAHFSTFLQGAEVTIVADKDEAGRTHACDVAASLAGIAKSVRIVEAASGKDAADHLAAGLGVGAFVEVAANAALAQSLDAILGLLVDALTRYVVFPNEHAPVAAAHWIVHTHVFEQAEATPYLAVISAEKRSGKTRMLDVLERLVARAWRAVLPSEAVVFRKIAADRPTLLLDEVDAIFGPKAPTHEGLRALLNAGHRAGSTVPRCVGDGPRMHVVDFATFCPKALAGIGELPDTVADRSIAIRLRRRAPGESVQRFRARDAERELGPLRTALGVWARGAKLSEARPLVPDGLEDRAADGWEPLLAIAEAAGGSWPDRARAAAQALSAPQEDSDASLGVKLLVDIRGAFRNVEVLFSRDLCNALNALDERPWGAFRDGKGIDGRGLARLLKPYEVRRRDVRIGDETGKGFRAVDFADAWSRYCPAPVSPSLISDTVTVEQDQALPADQKQGVSLIESESKSADLLGCHRCLRSDGGDEGYGDSAQALDGLDGEAEGAGAGLVPETEEHLL